ncbi:MAG TPA: enoyl-CoA hydratase-related protein [Steroidobacteraceae bacterium]
MSGLLRLELAPPLARIKIDRLPRKNAFNHAMWELLPTLLEQCVDDPETRVIVMQSSAPGAFSAGADISEFSSRASNPEWMAANQAAIRRAQRDLARVAKPTLALIEGDCVGGGCGLALACDIRVASPAARFGIPAAKLGLSYSLHDTKLLVDLVGPSQAKRLLFSGQLVPAAEAQRIGLVDLVCEDVPEQAATLANAIASASPAAIAVIKSVIREILDGQADDDARTRHRFEAAFTSEDFKEGVAAFLEKRPPRFHALRRNAPVE